MVTITTAACFKYCRGVVTLLLVVMLVAVLEMIVVANPTTVLHLMYLPHTTHVGPERGQRR